MTLLALPARVQCCPQHCQGLSQFSSPCSWSLPWDCCDQGAGLGILSLQGGILISFHFATPNLYAAAPGLGKKKSLFTGVAPQEISANSVTQEQGKLCDGQAPVSANPRFCGVCSPPAQFDWICPNLLSFLWSSVPARG